MKQYQRAMATMIVGQIVSLACGLWICEQFSRFAIDRHTSEAPAASYETMSTQTNSQRLVGRGLTLIWIGGLQAGVVYLVMTRLRNETSKGHDESKMRILHREKDLVRTRNAIIFGLAKLADYRDRETGQHLERIALYSTCLASALRSEPEYRDSVSASFAKLIGISSVLHDIGKVAIEDAILRKPGAFDAKERERMQQHVEVGAKCIREIEQRLGSCNFLAMAREIAQCHHETWDGQGYPLGISKEQIPLSGRIVAVADVYDALASKRVYKDSYDHEKCVEFIAAASGTQFAPRIVDVFLRAAPQFQKIAQRFSDRPVHSSSPTSQKPVAGTSTDPLITSVLEQGKHGDSFAVIP